MSCWPPALTHFCGFGCLAAAPAAQGPAASSQPAAAEAVPDEMEGIDPEFIAALPPDIQAEVLEQQRRERRRRQAAQQREAARQVPMQCILQGSSRKKA